MVVGLTVVAFGTSSPELFATLIAALQGAPEIALGNVVGSNVFNLLGILGATALVRPLAVPPGALARDLWVMLGFRLILAPFQATGLRLGRREALVLLLAYLAYVGLLFRP